MQFVCHGSPLAVRSTGHAKAQSGRDRNKGLLVGEGESDFLRMLQFAEWEPDNAFFKAHPRIPRRKPGHLPYRACRDIRRRVKFPLEPDTLPDYEVSFSHESPQLAIKNQPLY
jgi:hypothetical protein